MHAFPHAITETSGNPSPDGRAASLPSAQERNPGRPGARDKRSSAQAFLGARGRNASAEIVIPGRTVNRYWRADAAAMVRCWDQAVACAAQTGAVGLQANVANGLAALFIACGQDVACVSEATTSITRFETKGDGDLYASVTLPNLIIGTVGGGTDDQVG